MAMQHSVIFYRPLTALILLLACNGETATSLSGKSSAVTSGVAASEGNVGVGTTDPAPADPEANEPVEQPSPDNAVSEPSTDAGALLPPAVDAAATEPPVLVADAGTAAPDSLPPPLGACLSCAQNTCTVQFANALGAASSAENLALVGQLLGCVVGADWQAGGGIPADSCFFSDPTQPAGSMVPCYCGSTPTAQCLATGPADSSEACGREIELASGCSPVTASCVTTSGSSPTVALGDVLQLFNCERVACTIECGFPPPVEE